MALWCSRLARQPVTLEVDGSSPFGVAKFRPELVSGLKNASVAQSVEQWTENPRVVGSIPTGGTNLVADIGIEGIRFRRSAPICGCSSSGRAPPCQGGGSEFEPRHPLHKKLQAFGLEFFSLLSRYILMQSEYLQIPSPRGASAPKRYEI